MLLALLGFATLLVGADTLSVPGTSWSVATDGRVETFAHDRPDWTEGTVTFGWHHPEASLLGSASRLGRHDQTSVALAVEGVTAFGPHTVGHARIRWAEDARVLPPLDLLAELSRGVGGGVSLSGGYRLLGGPAYRVDVLHGAATWTDGTWMASVRTSVAPGMGDAVYGVSGVLRWYRHPDRRDRGVVEVRGGRERDVTPFGTDDVLVVETWRAAVRAEGPLAGPFGLRAGVGYLRGAPLTRRTFELGLVARL